LLTVCLLAMAFNADARRRGLRIEAHWSNPEAGPCGPATYSSVVLGEFEFKAQWSPEPYCQYALQYDPETNSTTDSYFNAEILFDEEGLAQKVGENRSGAVWAESYTFPNDVDGGSQWAIYVFNGGVALVSAYGDTHRDWPVIEFQGETLWSHSLYDPPGWDGQYWCFVKEGIEKPWEYAGTWDGEPVGTDPLAGCYGACTSLNLGVNGNGREPAVSPSRSEGCPAGKFKPGEVVTLTAFPDPGWITAHWYSPGEFELEYGQSVQQVVIPAVDYYDQLYFTVEYEKVQFCDAYNGEAREIVLIGDDMESGAPGWTPSALTGVGTWALTSSDYYTPGNAWHAMSDGSVSDQVLESPTVVFPEDAVKLQLSFYNRRIFETSSQSCPDGAILEYSTDEGSSWNGVSELDFLNDSYNGVVSDLSNPLADESAWCGQSPWVQTEVNLSSLGLAGQDVRFRFRFGSDAQNSSEGWYIDDVRVVACLSESIFEDSFENTGATPP
jgi:hypothetical protein